MVPACQEAAGLTWLNWHKHGSQRVGTGKLSVLVQGGPTDKRCKLHDLIVSMVREVCTYRDKGRLSHKAF